MHSSLLKKDCTWGNACTSDDGIEQLVDETSARNVKRCTWHLRANTIAMSAYRRDILNLNLHTIDSIDWKQYVRKGFNFAKTRA